MAPGADILLNAIEPYAHDLNPNTMTTEQWIQLVNAFHNWPFKPDVLEDETYIEDNVVEDMKNTTVMPTRELTTSARLLLEEEEDEDYLDSPEVDDVSDIEEEEDVKI